jgi:neprosin-like protein
MKTTLALVVAWTAIGVVAYGCGVAHDDDPEEAFRTAELDLASSTPENGAPDAGRANRQQEVDAYYSRKSEGWIVVDTRQSPSGQIIDYVLAETLYPDDPAAPFAPPPEDEPSPEEIEGPDGSPVRRGFTEIEVEPALHPPAGTIPVLRDQFLQYVDHGEAFESLDDYIAQLPNPVVNQTTSGKLYGLHQTVATNQDLGATINLWNYNDVDFSGDLSLMQIGEGCSSGGAVRDSVEAGFVKSWDVFGDDKLHLFTFFTVQGYGPDADYVEGWNLQKKGFVQAAGATTFPGATMSSATMSIQGGAQYECPLRIRRVSDGNWWVSACGSFIGYYPTQFSTTVAASKKINYSVMHTSGCFMSVYGEVGSHRGSFWGPTNMGSGQYASAGYGQAAYIRQSEYRPTFIPPLSTPIAFPNSPSRPKPPTLGLRCRLLHRIR